MAISSKMSGALGRRSLTCDLQDNCWGLELSKSIFTRLSGNWHWLWDRTNIQNTFFFFWPLDLWDLFPWPGIQSGCTSMEVRSPTGWPRNSQPEHFYVIWLPNCVVASEWSDVSYIPKKSAPGHLTRSCDILSQNKSHNPNKVPHSTASCIWGDD